MLLFKELYNLIAHYLPQITLIVAISIRLYTTIKKSFKKYAKIEKDAYSEIFVQLKTFKSNSFACAWNNSYKCNV